MNILVTGGCGFIGSHFIEEMLKRDDVEQLINIDSMTYAANTDLQFGLDNRYKHFKIDINSNFIQFLLKTFKINYVVHFAAESHVDNSIKDSSPFVKTNVLGTHNLLQCALNYDNLSKFIHVSTDEVFGSLTKDEKPFTVNNPYKPNSPYAASKASSDLMVRSFLQTYKFPAIITNCSNNFGPRQHKEKLIPTCIRKLQLGQPIPVYGDGTNVRDWIYVKDHVNALIRVLEDGTIGEQYLIGGNYELSNLELVQHIKTSYEEITNTVVDSSYIKFVNDRKGHDFRYAIDNHGFEDRLGKLHLSDFGESLKQTITSYLVNDRITALL
jgi:dTDP-glucose 4,6-dehydratase